MAKQRNQTSGAYKPKKPFKSIEGIGSKSWEMLSRNAVFVLVKFYEKFKGYNRYDLSLTYGEVRHKMTNRPFADALLELISFGFLDKKRSGRLERQCSIYGLSSRWSRLDQQPIKLDEIKLLVDKIKILRREKGSVEKRMEINKLYKKILKLSMG